MGPQQDWKNLGFLEKVFRFFRFQCTNKAGHKISTQEEHPIHHSLCYIDVYKS